MATKHFLQRHGLAASLLSAMLAISGCGGDSSSSTPDPLPPEPPPPTTCTIPTGPSPIVLSAATAPATFAALDIKVTVCTVAIAGKPVVNFSLTDASGNAVIGYGSRSQSATATVPSYPNLSFALAKLMPTSNGEPNYWVSYIVSTVPTKNASTGAITASVPTRPTSDSTGTLVDNRNGTYVYTFYRDVTTMKAFVDSFSATDPTVTSLGNLSYQADATTRLTMQLSGNAPGTGTNTANGVQVTTGVPMLNPVNVIHDFVPSTGKVLTQADALRTIVDKASCNECHAKLGGIPGAESEGFHAGGRYDPGYCMVCHTDQRKYGRTNVASTDLMFPLDSKGVPVATYVANTQTVGNMPVLIHKLHLGELLANRTYNFAGVLLNETLYPQDVRNCTKCHDGSPTAKHQTPQGDNWKTTPTIAACGACHDGIDFATGLGVTLSDAWKGMTTSKYGHIGGPQPDNTLCTLCHKPANIEIYHKPVTEPNPQNSLEVAGGNNNTAAAWIAGNPKNLPAGAITVTYDIRSVSVAAGKPVIVFRMLQNGARRDFDPYATAPVNALTGTKELWTNFVGSPSAYFVFSVPQDGIAKPSDFNASASGYIRNIWNGTATGTGAGTLAGPDSDGYYTITLTGVTVPANAVMVTGGLGYTYGLTATQPLTQIDLPDYPVKVSPIKPTLLVGGLIVASQDSQMVAAGYEPRRKIVEDGRCDKCHEQLGIFTTESFHAGQRNDGATCSWCHNPNRTSSGWTAASSGFIHAIHAASLRTQPYTWHATQAPDPTATPPVPGKSFANIGYPGILNACEACHVAGTYDFSAPASASALPNRQYVTVATGKFNGSSSDKLAVYQLSPYVTKNNVFDYGVGFSFNAATGATTQAAATTAVISPITASCFACHDSTTATDHMKHEGGSIYEARGTALTKAENCMACHGPDRLASIRAAHKLK